MANDTDIADSVKNPAFILKDAENDLRAYVTWDDDPNKAFVSVSDPERGQMITMSKAVFDRLVGAVEKQF